MLKNISIAALILLVTVPLLLWWLVQRPLPAQDGAVLAACLTRPVIVKFDARAVPYIEALSEADAYRAQGYVTASERMFQMDMARRAACGCLAEVFGGSALPSDRLMRSLGIRRLAEEELKALDEPARECLDSYAAGVNAYLAAAADRLPLEFVILGYAPGKWTAADSLAILKHQCYELDESWRLDDLRQRAADKAGTGLAAELFKDDWSALSSPGQEKQLRSSLEFRTDSAARCTALKGRSLLPALSHLAAGAEFLPAPRPLWGSTAWVVPPSASATASVMLACDKHNSFVNPCPWFICSLRAPGLHVAGATIAGVPGVAAGRNENICWGSASLKADVQDLFLEQFKSQFDASYRTPSGFAEAGVITEVIPVRFGRDVEHKVFITRHGPVLLRAEQSAFSLDWQGYAAGRPAFNALYRLNRASDFESFRNSLQLYPGPAQLFVYGDRAGNIACQAAGDIPVRNACADGTMLNCGWSSNGDWKGTVPFEKLPACFISYSTPPPAGSQPLIAANQKLASARGALPRVDASLLIGHQFCPPWRANRLLSTLAPSGGLKQAIPFPYLSELQGDQFCQLTSLVKKELQGAAVKVQLVDKGQLLATRLLARWDGQLRGDDGAATVYRSFLETLARRLLEPKLGREMTGQYLETWQLWPTFAEHFLRDHPARWLPPEERTYDTFLLTTLSQSLKGLKLSFASSDPERWTWQNIHQATFKHLLTRSAPWLGFLFNIGPVGVGGDDDCLNSCNVVPDVCAVHFTSDSGPTLRTVIDMGDGDKFYESIAVGQSGHFFSTHRLDQLNSWLHADPLPVAFSDAQVSRQVQHKLVLENEKTR